MRRLLAFTIGLLTGGGVCFGAAPVFKVATAVDNSSTDLIRNGNFEDTAQAKAWSPAPKGFSPADGEGRSGSRALRCANTNAGEWAGGSQTISLNRTQAVPLVVRGWSKSRDVSGSPDSGYSLYVDLVYEDGTPLWGRTANFRCGTHDWQEREIVIFPEKPVRSLTLNCILRGHSGVVWFDDIRVQEIRTDAGTALFDGVPIVIQKQPNLLAPRRNPATYATKDGLRLTLEDSRISSLSVDNNRLAGGAASGFFARDVASNSGFYPFERDLCRELGLKLNFQCGATSKAVYITGSIADLRQKDRAVTLYFALPFSGPGWVWGDDIRRSRKVAGTAESSRTAPVGCGATGTMSLYPFAAIWNEKVGLGLGLDMAHASQFRLACNPSSQQLYLALDYGLVPEAQAFGAHQFAFTVFGFDPGWGFRSAFEKYATIFPEQFQVRSLDQGIWMPFTDVSTVKGWEDFGFKYHEGNNNVPWDDAHGILSFRYTEPMTWWMPMSKDIRRTTEEALRVRDTLADKSNHMARISKATAMWDDQSQPALSLQDTPWCNGAVWSLNPNPALPSAETNELGTGAGSLNAATVYWNENLKERLYGTSAKGRLDGEYLDSIEGYVTTDLNFRREHFRYTSVPLTFATDTKDPALFKGLAVYEFTRWLSHDVHQMNKLMFANGVPYRLGFLCPWLDVLGTETDWLRNGKYSPPSDEQMCYWRTLSGRKPYLLLMNTDYQAFGPEFVEKYFQRSLFYGMFPSMFSHNAADNPYWRNPKWYDRDRPLFKKYIPLVKKLAAAGWQPVTSAHSDNKDLFVERFGPTPDRLVYFTLLNDTREPQAGTLQIDLAALKAKQIKEVRDLVSGIQSQPAAKVSVSLHPQGATVLEVRF